MKTMTTEIRVPRLARALGWLLGLAPLLPAWGQYALEGCTVGGGGGTSAGGAYRVEATVAPADAIVLTGGGYRVAGGFWADVAPPVPDLPVLTVLRAGNLIAISWSPATPGFALETTEDLAAPAWTPVPNAISQGTTLTLGPRTGFFRLVRR